MAAAAVPADASSSLENDRKARRLQELFKGRFSQGEALAIIVDKDGDIPAAVDFIMRGSPEQIRKFLHSQNQNLLQELRRDTTILYKNLRSGLPCTVRQFGCGPCDNFWWQKVPSRKEVSSCKKCKIKYDPVPRGHEWGWAEFKCPCGNEFNGFGQIGHTGSPCFKCHTVSFPLKILPPRRNNRQRRSTDHACNGTNCYNAPMYGRGGFGGGDRGRGWGGRGRGNREPRCCHPRSIRASGGKMVLYASQPHRSTGSTVGTFLTQDDLVSHAGTFTSSLVDVREDDEEALAGSDREDSDGGPADDGQ
ncbi:shiftless antiviral inhibitor of ribosomal frameshifting protein homolog [Haliotis rubra]|uniref:shiftless antiviral inhibitor of ribosomal frameshifting protein homolog n=1 Tax=Haliotis rubra TaxID=36100 RepID=UPI001EE61A94|nr:shiftless antiviral inhibitor of ribosomal frameshifting protein homolog [Haliotis rubra]